MKSGRSLYYGHRFPPEVLSYAVWVYHRFCLSFRDVEDLLAERGIIVSYETIQSGLTIACDCRRMQVRFLDISLCHDLFEVAQAERVSKISSNTQNDDLGFEMSSFERWPVPLHKGPTATRPVLSTFTRSPCIRPAMRNTLTPIHLDWTG